MAWPAHPDDVLDDQGIPQPSQRTVEKVCMACTVALAHVFGIPASAKTEQRDRLLVGLHSRRLVRDRDGYKATLRWCSTHLEPAWQYEDGSTSCPYDLIVEASTDHAIEDGPWELGS